MKTFAIDYETFYSTKCSVKTLPPEIYTRHPDFVAYMVSIVGPGVEYVGIPENAPWKEIDGHIWVAHNAAFDRQVHRAACPTDGVHWGQPSKWICTANMAAYFQIGRSLKAAVKECFDIDMDKGVRTAMRGKLPEDLSVSEMDALEDYALEDSKLCLRLYHHLAPHWPEIEQQVSEHTISMGFKGIHLNLSELEKQRALLTIARQEALDALPWYPERKPLSIPAFHAQCDIAEIPRPSTTAVDSEEFPAWLEIYAEEAPWALALGSLRRSNRALKIVELLDRKAAAVCSPTPGGFLKLPNKVAESGEKRGQLAPWCQFALKYFGAGATGRWSGAAGFNIQNLKREEDEFGANLRHLIIPAPGRAFVGADLSAIEPRCLAWLCHDWDFLSLVEGGMDVYEAHARATMGYMDTRPLKDVDPKLRGICKARVLGLGYGAGPDRFVSMAKTLAGLDITLEESERIVADYRGSNPRVVRFWKQIDQDLRKSSGRNESELVFGLPSGRSMRYSRPGRSEGSNWAEVGGSARRFWGSKLVENLCQGMARDVLAKKIIELEEAGLPVIFHVHDEVICEIPMESKDQMEQDRLRVEQIMSSRVDWAKKLPLAAEAHVMRKYTK